MRRQGPISPSLPGSARQQALFDPRSITVLGASDDPAKWGHIMARRALESCGGRPVRLVNRRGVPVLGRATDVTPADASRNLGEPLDLVAVCVPADELPGAVTQAVAAGARSLVVITAGLAELGSAGAEVERELARVVRAAGARAVGPNCLGLVDTTTNLQLTHDLLPPGDVAVLSQSGNVGLDIAALLEERRLGVSRFVSVGNQADVTVVDLMASCLDHDATRAVAVYAEDVVDGRGFVRVARHLQEAGKPVVLLAPGRSDGAVRAAVSHTGSMVTGHGVVDAVCRATGIHRADSPTEMADMLEGLRSSRRMVGTRAAVLTDGGGHGAIAADALATVGLDTPVLSLATQDALRAMLREGSSVLNPVDLAGAGEQDARTYVRALAALVADDDVDGVLVTGYFGSYSAGDSAMAAREVVAAQEMARLVSEQTSPVVVQTMHPRSPSATVLRDAGIPVHRDVDRAAAVLAVLVDHGDLDGPVCVPPATAPLTDTSYDGARRLFATAGVPFAPARTVIDEASFEAALDVVGFPLVLKALGRVHKSEGGGVVVGVGTHEEARAAYADMCHRLRPPAISVEAMVDTQQGVELLVGCVQDPRFGPILMVGLGGVFAEVLADTATALAPVTPDAARRLLLSLRGAPLLTGVRGRAPVDLGSLADVVSKISAVAAEHPELAELELNPVHAGATGVVALDARVSLGSAGGATSGPELGVEETHHPSLPRTGGGP